MSHWLYILYISESKPTCRLSKNVAAATDHIEIQCHVRYNGSCTTPVFRCDPHLPSATHHTHRNSSGHVRYRHVVAASDIDDFAVFNCSMTFNLTDNYRAMYSAIPVKPDNPVKEFVWSSLAVHIVNVSGKFSAFTQTLVNYCYKCNSAVINYNSSDCY